MHRNDPISAQKSIAPPDLARRSVVAITGQHMVDRQLDTLLSAANVTVEKHISSYYFAIARNIIASGGGVAIVDPTNGKANLNDGVVWRPFSPKIYHELALIRASDQELSKASASLYGMIDRSLQSLIGIGNAGESYE